jgi:ABC-2 type transport system permease protein
MKTLQIQIQREFWEHRGLWIVPLTIAAVMLSAAAVFGHVQIDFNSAANHYDGPVPPPLVELVALGWGMPFYLAAIIQSSAYLVDCLYAERRDRSILFWRSMPVTDTRAVLVKLLVGLVLVPLGAFLIAAVTSLVGSAILVLRNHHLIINGQRVTALWDTLAWLRMQAVTVYGLLAAMLWYAPFAAYLMLASVWARRSPYIWALAPPLLLVLLEHMVFGTHYVAHVANGGFNELLHLAYDLPQHDAIAVAPLRPGAGPDPDGIGTVHFSMQMPTPLHLLSSVRLWAGLVAAVGMIALAIRLRRYRDES